MIDNYARLMKSDSTLPNERARYNYKSANEVNLCLRDVIVFRNFVLSI